MNTIQISLNDVTEELQEIWIAQLSEIGFEGFEQAETELQAFIAEDLWNAEEFAAITNNHPFSTQLIGPRNWNAEWEQSFEPVVVEDFCTIKADFHTIVSTTTHEIKITPKMSFGTGHHATTQLMISLMRNVDFKGAKVLDFGTGTGVLAILAEMLGAGDVLAIDNDEWSVTNTEENIARNKSIVTKVQLFTGETLAEEKFNVILANINRHVLLQFMPQLYDRLTENGMLILSGILNEDKPAILKSATENGLNYINEKDQNAWSAMTFKR